MTTFQDVYEAVEIDEALSPELKSYRSGIKAHKSSGNTLTPSLKTKAQDAQTMSRIARDATKKTLGKGGSEHHAAAYKAHEQASMQASKMAGTLQKHGHEHLAKAFSSLAAHHTNMQKQHQHAAPRYKNPGGDTASMAD